MTDDKLFEFAKECAAAYCRKHGDLSQFDEATSESCDWLLDNRKLWNLPDGALKWRAVKRLVRWYQDAHGLRKKDPLPVRLPDYDLESVRETRLEFYVEDLEVRDTVRRAMEQAELTGAAEIVWSWVYQLGTRRELSVKFGLSLSRLDRMRKRFKRELKKLVDVRGVVIVNSATREEIEECPLFLYLTGAGTSA